MFFNLIKTYMRPLDGTEHDYIIHAYSDPKENDDIRPLSLKKVTSINIRLLSLKYHTYLAQGAK